jgi:hypothetical protein
MILERCTQAVYVRYCSMAKTAFYTVRQPGLTRCEADAAYYEDCAQRCRTEAALLREELENERAGKRPGLEEAHRLAEAILRLDGLTGAEIEAAESALSVPWRAQP